MRKKQLVVIVTVVLGVGVTYLNGSIVGYSCIDSHLFLLEHLLLVFFSSYSSFLAAEVISQLQQQQQFHR